MSKVIVTLDLDWACEAAIEETLEYLKGKGIKSTVFATHHSPYIKACFNELDIGLHPYFGNDSSHGTTIEEVVKHICDIPHNLPAFRCHRFSICNTSRQAMAAAGMKISSNICTDLEIVAPFKERCGMIEVPIFMEDGGYLWRKHSLVVENSLLTKLKQEGIKVLLLHPMHFALNTPHFNYMRDIKQSLRRDEWNNLSQTVINDLRWSGRGIRNVIEELLAHTTDTLTLRSLLPTT